MNIYLGFACDLFSGGGFLAGYYFLLHIAQIIKALFMYVATNEKVYTIELVSL